MLDREFPGLRYSAGRIDSGSEVLGFDTPMSMDHDWGPRVQIFLEEPDPSCSEAYGDSGDSGSYSIEGRSLCLAIEAELERALPARFLGFPTRFPRSDRSGSSRPVQHWVRAVTVREFFHTYLGIHIDEEMTPADWLTLPEQKLRTVTTGALFQDAIGLDAVRERFRWYPRDVWLYLLAAGWTRIGQEEHLMGRAGAVGD